MSFNNYLNPPCIKIPNRQILIPKPTLLIFALSKNNMMESVLENELPVGSRGTAEQGVAKPKWLRVKLPIGQKYTELRGLVDKYSLNTICTSGSCPNMGE